MSDDNIIKICKNCDNEFIPNNGKQKCCSKKCSSENYRYILKLRKLWNNINIDYKTLLIKYIKHVRFCEGTDFINRLEENYISVKFTKEEVLELIEISKIICGNGNDNE